MRRIILATGLRLAVLALLLFPLTDIMDRHAFSDPQRIMLVDDSLSMRMRFPSFFTQPLQRGPLERFGLPIAAFRSYPLPAGKETDAGSEITDLAAALRLAPGLFSDAPGERQVLIFTDGITDGAKALAAADELARQGVSIYALRPASQAVLVDVFELHAPEKVSLWQPFTVKGRIVSSRPGTVEVHLLRNGVVVSRKEVVIDQKGLAEIEFLQDAHEVGLLRYDLRVEEDPALFASSLVTVADSPRILLLTSDPDASRDLLEIYRGAGIEVELMTPSRLMGGALDDAPWEVVILDDVPAMALAGSLEESLRKAVGLEGRGMIVVGGRKGLGTEEYRHTVLESMMPVSIGHTPPPPPASISIVLAMDTSLSMLSTGTEGMSINPVLGKPRKIDIAKESAAELVKVLRPQDRMGILGNSTDLYWVIRLFETPEQEGALARIENISAIGGGINFFSIVREAWQALRDDPAPVRHIMVFCDANDIDQYEVLGEGHAHSMIRDMAEEGITLSVLAIGDITDKDIPFLQTAAVLGNGDFHLISNIVALPRYFVSDYRKLASRFYVEEPLHIIENDYSSLMQRDEGPLPGIRGANTVTPRRGSTVPLVTSLDTPLVALGKYGGGHTAVFASDNGQRWAGEWVRGDAAARFWLQLLFAVAPAEESTSRDHLALQAGRGQDGFDMILRPRQGGFPPWDSLLASYAGAGSARKQKKMVRTGLYRYSAKALLPERRLLQASFMPEDEIGPTSIGSASVFVPAGYERTALPENWELVDRVLEKTGGKWVSGPEGLDRPLFRLPFGRTILHLIVLTLSLTLLVVETAIRHHFWR